MHLIRTGREKLFGPAKPPAYPRTVHPGGPRHRHVMNSVPDHDFCTALQPDGLDGLQDHEGMWLARAVISAPGGLEQMSQPMPFEERFQTPVGFARCNTHDPACVMKGLEGFESAGIQGLMQARSETMGDEGCLIGFDKTFEIGPAEIFRRKPAAGFVQAEAYRPAGFVIIGRPEPTSTERGLHTRLDDFAAVDDRAIHIPD